MAAIPLPEQLQSQALYQRRDTWLMIGPNPGRSQIAGKVSDGHRMGKNSAAATVSRFKYGDVAIALK
jgi:hypothetical protein